MSAATDKTNLADLRRTMTLWHNRVTALGFDGVSDLIELAEAGGVNWLGGKPPKPGDLLCRAEDINQGRAGLREAAQHALITLDGIADTNPRNTADFETPAEWITWAKSRARWAADALRDDYEAPH